MADRSPRSWPGELRGTALGRLIDHLQVPLYGGAYALIFSSGATSVLGIVYWTLAARLCGTVEVGVNAAAISAMVFLSYLAQFNLSGAMTRFVPTAGRWTVRLVIGAYAVAVLASLAAGMIFVMGSGLWAPNIRPIVGSPLLAGWFVVSVAAWSLFALQDSVLTGLRRTVWVPIENTIYAIVKIGLLVVLAGSASGIGVFASWTVPAALTILPVNGLIFGRFIRAHAAKSGTAPPEGTAFQIARYLTGDYLGSLCVSAATGILPLVILAVVGAKGSAYFYMAWTMAYSLQLISMNSALSLTVEGAGRRDDVAHSVRRILWLLARLLVPLVAITIAFAPLILQLFGRDYATEASTLLRLFALGVLPHAVNAVFLSLARIRREITWLFGVQAAQAGLLMIFSLVLLPSMGITAVGVAFVISQSAVAAALSLTRLRPFLGAPSRTRDGVSTPEAATVPSVSVPVALGMAASNRARAFGELSRAGVRWTLLRPCSPTDPDDDVDVLVAERDYGTVALTLRGLGFLALPSSGRGSHRFFVGYDLAFAEWLSLDLVTELSYGRWFEFQTGLAPVCLDRASGSAFERRLDPDDELYCLVLHCLLDKEVISPRRASQLADLVNTRRAPGPVRGLLSELLPVAWTCDQIEATICEGNWPELESLSGPLAARWRRRDPRIVLRAAGRATGRVLEPLLANGTGLTVALVGPDGAGKSTLALRIKSTAALPVRCIYMGLWQRRPSRLGLAGHTADVAIRPFRLWRRYLTALAHRRLGRVVVFDRYSFDATLPPAGRLRPLKRAYFWFLAHSIPAPDALVILDAPGELLFARKGESKPEVLQAERAYFRDLANRVKNAVIVDSSAPEDEVFASVERLIWARLSEQDRRRTTQKRRRYVRIGSSRRSSVLSYGGVAWRRVAHWRRMTRAKPTIDLVLADLKTRSFVEDSWVPGRISVTETGVGLVRLGPLEEPGRLIVKLPLSAGAEDALETHVRVVRQLTADSRLRSWSDLLPIIRGEGQAGELRYVVEDLLPGRPASALVRGAARASALTAAAEAIAEMHDRTREQLLADDDVLDSWIWRPVRAVCAALPASLRSNMRVDAFHEIASCAVRAIGGREVRVGWIHGDYWPGNVLVSADGARATGIVDWDLAGPRQPPLHDAMDLILFARRIEQGRDLGILACSMLEDAGLDPVEEQVIRTVGLGWPADEAGIRIAVVLAWLRHVGSVAGVSGHGQNPWWVRRNLDPVLRIPASHIAS
jgi:O-antigen/teichoic acid export membrane protein/thymidylate kinase